MFAPNQQNPRRCPNGTMSPQAHVGGGSVSRCGPTSLPHCWDAVVRGTGKKPPSVGYLFPVNFIALKLHQGPELLCVGGCWRSMTIFPFIYRPSRFLLSTQLRQVVGNGLLGAFSALEVHNVDVYLKVGGYLSENKKSTSLLQKRDPALKSPLKFPYKCGSVLIPILKNTQTNKTLRWSIAAIRHLHKRKALTNMKCSYAGNK